MHVFLLNTHFDVMTCLFAGPSTIEKTLIPPKILSLLCIRHAKALRLASPWLACRFLDHQYRFPLLQRGAFEQGEEVARLKKKLCCGEALGLLLAAAEGLVVVWKEESAAPSAKDRVLSWRWRKAVDTVEICSI